MLYESNRYENRLFICRQIDRLIENSKQKDSRIFLAKLVIQYTNKKLTENLFIFNYIYLLCEMMIQFYYTYI